MDTKQKVKRALNLAEFSRNDSAYERKKNKNNYSKVRRRGLKKVSSAPDSPLKKFGQKLDKLGNPRQALRPLIRKANRIILGDSINTSLSPSNASSQIITFEKENSEIAKQRRFTIDVNHLNPRRDRQFTTLDVEKPRQQRRFTTYDMQDQIKRSSQRKRSIEVQNLQKHFAKQRATFDLDMGLAEQRERAFSQLLTYDDRHKNYGEDPLNFLYLTEDCYDIMGKPSCALPYTLQMYNRERKQILNLRRSHN